MKNSFIQSNKIVVLSCLCILLASTNNFAQQTKKTVFKQANSAMENAKVMQADILSPLEFDNAMDRYNKAEDKFDKQRGIEKVEELLTESVNYFNRAVDFSISAKIIFANSLNAREDAISAGANLYARELWLDAEKQFKEAAEQLGKGDRDDSYEASVEAIAIYRKAELSAIKTDLLAETRRLLKKADEMDVADKAPKTLKKAKSLLAEAEKQLETSRYDMDYPRTLAKQAKYEAKHAIYLYKTINTMENNNQELEDVILGMEKPIMTIAATSGFVAEFDQGFHKPKEQIVTYVKDLQEKNYALDAKNIEQNYMIGQRDDNIKVLIKERDVLSTEFEMEIGKRTADMNKKMQDIENEKSMLSKRVSYQEKINERYELVNQLFESKDALVFRSGNDVIIRMQGFGFDVGKSNIKPEYFSLLTKVQSAISTFPESKVIVQGYTDSFGSDDSNLKLSQERSDAVTTYLKANMASLNVGNISSVGFGENNPIANNETVEGRSKNRRIDIIINNDETIFSQLEK
ncbi:OmpA family protein [Carboxylicivirga taeanensis]|uniref:OmpA family protein n=1 Tax=Carboxylicivirga taeanensis TaxID=1416875 RepID=UPI003F6DFB1F